MNGLLILVAAAVAATAAVGAGAPNAIVEKRERNLALAERFAPSCAQVRIFFKLDADGEPPACRVKYYCPNCKDFHEREAGSYLREERPMEGAAFALAQDRFLVQDLHLLADWVERIEIVFDGRAYAAREVLRYPQDNAVELRTEKPVEGVKPLVFSKRIDFLADKDGVFFFSTKDRGLAVCGTRGSAAAEVVRYGDIGKDIVSATGNAIAVNASNEAVTVSFRTKFALGEQAFRQPAEWASEPVGAFAGEWKAMEEKVAACTVPLYVHLDDEDNRKDGFSRRYRSYSHDSELTDIDTVGLVLPEGEVLASLELDASKMSEIDKIEATLKDGRKAPLEFVGAFTEVKLAVFRFADGKTPAGLVPATLDRRRPESRFLEPVFAADVKNFNGKAKVDLMRSQVEAFEVGRGGESIPNVSGVGGSNKSLSMVVYADGTVGGLSSKLRSGERYSGEELVSAAKLAKYLAERDFDPQFAIRKGKDRVRVAWIGVETQRMTDELAREKKATALMASAGTRGALVTRVWADTPAAKAGIAVGDVLLNVRPSKSHRLQDLQDNDSVEGFDWEEFFGMMGFDDFSGVSPWPNVEGGVNRTFTNLGIGKAVVVAYARNGERKEAELTLEQAPVHYQTAKRVKNKALGMIVSDMTFEVRGYFKFGEDAPGVVIAKVQPGNPAAIAGLRPLEIITHVNNEPVTSAKDFAKKVKGVQNLTFAVRRLAATRVVRIELKEKKNEK